MTQPSVGRPSLFCRVRARLCAMPLQHVVETMRPLPVEPLAGMPAFVMGLAVVRGQPLPVVDAGALLGDLEDPQHTRFVTLVTGRRNIALAVEAVLGVRELPPDLQGLPPLLREASAEVVSAIGTLDAELLLLLESARIVPDSVWQAVDRGGSRR